MWKEKVENAGDGSAEHQELSGALRHYFPFLLIFGSLRGSGGHAPHSEESRGQLQMWIPGVLSPSV